MKVISYQEQELPINPDESVLDCLLRNNIDFPYACKQGVCHVCVMSCSEGELPVAASDGLREIQKENGYFLACQFIPEQSVKVQDADESQLFVKAEVIKKDFLSAQVCRLLIKPKNHLEYKAGQFINIRMSRSYIRSYSLANLPSEEGILELHIKKMHNGKQSTWLFNEVNAGDVLDIQGPYGFCVYQPAITEFDILMVATGTGLAPLIGILAEAFENQHQGHISLYHGVESHADLYLHDTLIALSQKHHHFDYFPCIKSPNEEGDDEKHTALYVGRASDLAFANINDLSKTHVYLCGSPQMVESSETQAIKLAAVKAQIHCDPFVTKDLRLGKLRSSSSPLGNKE